MVAQVHCEHETVFITGQGHGSLQLLSLLSSATIALPEFKATDLELEYPVIMPNVPAMAYNNRILRYQLVITLRISFPPICQVLPR